MKIKINQKDYTLTELGFKDMVKMEDMGFSVLDLFQKQKVFSLAAAFVGVCADCGKEEAEQICEQHVLGGGSIEELCQQFMELVQGSGFFNQFLKNGEQNKEQIQAQSA